MQHFLALDPSLGRITVDTLSDLQMMELLVEGLTEVCKSRYRNSHGEFDIATWPGVTLDDEERVVSVHLRSPVKGSFQLQFIPRNVRKFRILGVKPTGTLEIESLPQTLEFITLFETRI